MTNSPIPLEFYQPVTLGSGPEAIHIRPVDMNLHQFRAHIAQLEAEAARLDAEAEASALTTK
jgi:hypothetical protein